MAITLGTFTKLDDGVFSGTLKTLNVTAALTIVPVDKILDEVKPDRLIVALTERRGRMPMGQLLECGAKGILVEDGLRTYESFTGKLPIEALTPSFLIFSGAFRKSRLQVGWRRVSSMLAAFIGVLLSAPLMVAIAVAIKLDSRGPSRSEGPGLSAHQIPHHASGRARPAPCRLGVGPR